MGSDRWEWFGSALERARFQATYQADPLATIPRDAPKSVWACMLGAWSMVTLDRASGELAAHRFRCRSWRCPECRYDVARGDFARILGALEGRTGAGREWLLVTLTFDPRRYRSRWDAYRAGGRCWQRLRYRLARRYGSRSAPARIRYVQVWEQHRSGWPHVHLALSCPELVQDVRTRGVRGVRFDVRADRRIPLWAWKRDVLDTLATACGFGIVSDVQFPRAKEGGVAGYFAKLSAELVGVFDQRPVEAPRGFRRLRASLRLLPQRRQPTGRYLGRLVQRPERYVSKHLDTCALPVAGPTTLAWPPTVQAPKSGSSLPVPAPRLGQVLRAGVDPPCTRADSG